MLTKSSHYVRIFRKQIISKTITSNKFLFLSGPNDGEAERGEGRGRGRVEGREERKERKKGKKEGRKRKERKEKERYLLSKAYFNYITTKALKSFSVENLGVYIHTGYIYPHCVSS